jgi:hypothetical protein
MIPVSIKNRSINPKELAWDGSRNCGFVWSRGTMAEKGPTLEIGKGQDI